ncbi:hypothetical protein R50073_43270 [Maricurvus nonylphenolicus]|uniref:MBL fold metallo-hydrolase n=1 Tax=Maricurvus nonylphenolicus TaxID=1008307 RepID=UPI0036F1B349
MKKILLCCLALLVVGLVSLGLWIQGGSSKPGNTAKTALDDTPFRTYEAVVPDSPLKLTHFISEANEINVSSSLIVGENEMIVVATQGTKYASERLADEIEKMGKKLTYVYLGHAHLDHSQGARILKDRFPDAKFIAEPKVAALQQLRMTDDDARAVKRFGDNAAVPSLPFEAYDHDVLMLEGREIQLWHDQYGDVGIGHEDEPHTVVYIPDLKALLPNDIAYYRAHMMMGGSTKASRAIWKQQLRDYMKMDLQVVIPGHLPRSQSADMTPSAVLEHSLTYIEAYETALEGSESSDEVIEKMLEKYPGMEHTSALFLGTYMNFVETHRLLFNPRLEKVMSWFPSSFVQWFDHTMWEKKKVTQNLPHDHEHI